MTYCMNFYLNWRRNYTWSNLEACFLLSKYQSSSYDHVYFLCQLRQKFIQQLILKLLSIVKRDAQGQRMLAFLHSKTALCKRAIQYIKPALFEQKFSALYLQIIFFQITLGAMLIIFKVPIWMGIFHQFMGLLLFACISVLLFYINQKIQ